MPFVITLRDFTPPRREDGNPWTKARVRESADGITSWSQIEEFTFVDPDVDPRNPKSRSFTTELATLERGWYDIIFVDGTSDTSPPSDPVLNAAIPKWAPSVRDVAGRLRARTKDDAMNELGMFNADTRPTAEQAEREIFSAADTVNALLPTTPSAVIQSAAKRLAETLAAMQIELSYWPEQIEKGNSPYAGLERQYQRDYENLFKLLYPDVSEGGAIPGTAPAMPSFSYPEDRGGMVGWGTRW